MNSDLPVIQTPRLIIRLGQKEDVAAILRFYERNRTHLTPWWPHWKPDFFTEEHWQRQVAKNLQEFTGDVSARLFLFAANAPDRIVGMCSANNITRGSAHYCWLGYALDAEEEGKGLMAEALQAVIAYLFESRNMHRIQACYIPRNQRSANVLRQLGFVVDGYARDYLFINGRWEDHVLTSLVNPNWLPPAE